MHLGNATREQRRQVRAVCVAAIVDIHALQPRTLTTHPSPVTTYAPPIRVNRAPVVTLWATVVAERLGYPPATALTLGRFIAGSSARAKARRLGISDEKQDAEERHARAAELKPRRQTPPGTGLSLGCHRGPRHGVGRPAFRDWSKRVAAQYDMRASVGAMGTSTGSTVPPGTIFA